MDDDEYAALAAMHRDGLLAIGEFRPGGVEREWCDEEVLRRALAMGADEALHLEDDAFLGCDASGIAMVTADPSAVHPVGVSLRG